MVRSNKTGNDSQQSDNIPHHMAEFMDNLNMMKGIPVSVREQWLKDGFSETAAEQAALLVWAKMWEPGNNGS